MGIYDRDYIREDRVGGGGGFRRRMRGVGLAGLTMVQILIIVNVAVFFLDSFLPTVEVRVGDRFVEGFDPQGKQLVMEQQLVTASAGSSTVHGAVARRIIDPQTQQVVGERHLLGMKPLEALGHFSTGKSLFELQIWRFVTFQFLHSQSYWPHLLLNMIGLYFFGPVAERYLGSRRLFLAYYLACGIAGAAVYLLLNLVGSFFPDARMLFLVNDVFTPLVGASAGVFGVLMAAAFIAGKETMYLFFVLPVRVDIGVYGFVVLAAWNLITGGHNAGGDAAHLGGAIGGFFLIRHPRLLVDFLDDFLFSGPAKRGRKGRPSFRAKHGGVKGKAKGIGKKVKGMLGGGGEPSQVEVDAVLDKVNRSGMQSLSEREKGILRRASGED